MQGFFGVQSGTGGVALQIPAPYGEQIRKYGQEDGGSKQLIVWFWDNGPWAFFGSTMGSGPCETWMGPKKNNGPRKFRFDWI